MKFQITSLIFFIIVLLVACPSPAPPDPVTCEDGYHPCGPDSQECCLDTTSSDFTWVLDTIGLYGSDLFDATIISEDDIWVVGEIYIEDPDSLNGTGEAQYNAAHWNGSEWTYHVIYNLAPLRGVIAFGSNDVWFVNGIDVLHYDGSESVLVWRADAEQYGFYQITELWGTSPDNIYFAGKRGHIVHYNGTSFTHIPTNYDTDFRYITGTSDGEHVFIVGNPLYRLGENVVIHSIDDPLSWEKVAYPYSPNDSLSLPNVYSADVCGDELILPTREGIWRYNFMKLCSELVPASEIEYGEQLYRVTVVQSPNDIFFGGLTMEYIHYNGQSYNYTNDIRSNYSQLDGKGGDFRENTVIMVGSFNSWEGALVARGNR